MEITWKSSSFEWETFHTAILVISVKDSFIVQFKLFVGEQKIGKKTMKLHRLSTQEDQSSLFDDLSNHFQEKKIIFTANKNNKIHSLLEPLTEKLVLHRTWLSIETHHAAVH